MLTLLFDGVAYGMLLFVLALGLAVTMGLMNFINLAHGAFAMAGGYILVVLMQRHGVPFLACLPIAFFVTAVMGAVLERTLYRPMYGKPHLDQVLFSIGLTFMAVAAWLVWRAPQSPALKRVALGLFGAQLVANALWSWLFFGWRLGGLAFADVLLLCVLIACTQFAFGRISRPAAWLLLPYLLWVGFASVLNWTLWQLNPNLLG